MDERDELHRQPFVGAAEDERGDVGRREVGLAGGDELHVVDGAGAGLDRHVEPCVLEVAVLLGDVGVRVAPEGAERRQVGDLVDGALRSCRALGGRAGDEAEREHEHRRECERERATGFTSA